MGRAKKFFQKVGSFITDQFTPIKHGDSGNNTIDGNNLALNKLYGHDGNDKLTAFGARNELYGGNGDDTLRALGASNKLDGGNGNDRLEGLGAWNDLNGGTGNDELLGLGAYNEMEGGDGNDLLRGIGAYNKMDGGTGNDTIEGIGAYNKMDGGDGNDELRGVGAFNRMRGGAGSDVILAIGAANDADGGTGDDVITGIGGVNILRGGEGDDDITGIGGVNTIEGGDGEDRIIAVGGVNIADGGAGDDLMISVGGTNIMHGGAGNDLMIAAGVVSTQSGGTGDDVMIAVSAGNYQNGGDGNDMIFALGGANIQTGGAGDDILVGLGVGNAQDGGAGDDMLFAVGEANVQNGDDGDDLMVALGKYNLQIGGAGDDMMFGLASLNVQHGGSGNDVMVGLGSLNVQIGDDGDDLAFAVGSTNVQLGGAGRDVLVGLGNTNIQHGGSDDDILVAAGQFNLQIGAEGGDLLIGAGKGNIQFAGGFADLPTGIDAAGVEFELPSGQVLDLFNEHVTEVQPDTEQNVMIGGGKLNLQIGAAGNDVAVALGENSIQVLQDGDDIAIAGGKNNLQLGGDGNDFMLSAQQASKLAGSVQAGGAGDDIMATFINDVSGDPVGLQFGDDGNDIMAMVSLDFRYNDFGEASVKGVAKATFLDGATFQAGGEGDDLLISMVADFAVRSGGAGDDTFFNVGEGGFATGGDGDDFMVSGIIPTSLYTGGEGADMMMDFASYIRQAYNFAGEVADFFDTLVSQVVGNTSEGFSIVETLTDAVSDVTEMLNIVNPGAVAADFAQQFLTTFVLPAGNTFIGGDGDDVFGIASELTTAIGGAGDDSFIVHLDAITDVTLSDGNTVAELVEAAKTALDFVDTLAGGSTDETSEAGGADTVDLRGFSVAASDLSFSRTLTDLLLTVATSEGDKTLTFAGMAPAEGETDVSGRIETLRFSTGDTVTEIDLASAFDAGLFGTGADADLVLAYDADLFAPYTSAGDTTAADAAQTRVDATTAPVKDAFGALFDGLADLGTAAVDLLTDAGDTTIEEQPEDPEATPELTAEQQAEADAQGTPSDETIDVGTVEEIPVEDLTDVAPQRVSSEDVDRAPLTKTVAMSNGLLLVLYSDDSDSGADSIRGQLMDARGTPVGTELIFLTSGVDVDNWDAKALPGGRLAIVGDRDTMAEKAFLVTAQGELYPMPDPDKNTNFVSGQAQADLIGGGSVEITGVSQTIGSTGQLTIKLRDNGGDVIETIKVGNGDHSNYQSNVVALATGGFAVAFRSTDPYDDDVNVQMFDASGTPTTGRMQLFSTGTAPDQDGQPVLAALGDGSVLVIYNSDTGDDQIRAQRLDASGQAIGAEFVVYDGQSAHPSATTLDDGRVAITYATPNGEVATLIKVFDLDFEGGDGDDLFQGSVGDDIATGGAGSDALLGSAGSDTLRGNTGDDFVDGGAGNDSLGGGKGADVLSGGGGDDTMFGGIGADVFVFADSDGLHSGQDTVTDFEVGVDLLDFLQVSAVEGRSDIEITQVDGNAVVSVGESTVTLQGVSVDDLGEENFAHAGNTVGERGTVSVTDETLTVDLLGDYENPVVVAFVKTLNGGTMVEARVNSVTSTSFEIELIEPQNADGTHAAETVSYMVVEAGRHVLQNGSVIEAGLVDTDKVYQTTLDQGATAVAFDGDLSGADTRVFATVNSHNGDNFVTARVDNVDASGFDISLAESEADTGGHNVETVGYIAFEDGDFGDFSTGSIQLGSSAVATTADEFDFAQITEINGTDPAVIRQDLDAGTVFAQEDTSYDSETRHDNDDVAFIDFVQDDGLFLV